jgi:hypothetical protein
MAKRTNYFFIIFMIVFGMKIDAKEYESPVYTQYAVEIIRSFANQVEKEFGFECIGSGGSMPHDVQEISVKFIIYQDVTIPQARELEVKLTEKLVQVINAHEKIRPFLREHPFPSSRACVSLSFERPKKNFSIKNQRVKYVFQARGRIFYQAENPLNQYVYKDIKDESYEEALKIVQSQITKNTP